MVTPYRESDLLDGTTVDLAEYEALRGRKNAPRFMVQKWRNLSFLHTPCDPEVVQAQLPEGLTVDTFDGQAWIGLVPFEVHDARLPFLPTLPGLSSFPETNLRTYVHRDGKKPGIWFFSLDAGQWLVSKAARLALALPYFPAQMQVCQQGSRIAYKSHRERAESFITVQPKLQKLESTQGSLTYFLIERYLLYSERNGKLITAAVSHDPYPLVHAELTHCEESLVAAAGLPRPSWEHICFSPGVDVDMVVSR